VQKKETLRDSSNCETAKGKEKRGKYPNKDCHLVLPAGVKKINKTLDGKRF
jgi:hypothetical protein